MSDSSRLIWHLKRLVEQNDRGALAELRRGLGKEPGHSSGVLRHVVPWLPAGAGPQDDWNERAHYLVASLFALHTTWQGAGGGMGWTFRRIAGGPGDNPSLELRFRRLLECDSAELGAHLRQAVSLARSSKHHAPVDYGRLLTDICGWNYEDRRVQRRWAREFWGHRAETPTEATETDKG